jgi:hypothetical protein
MPSEYASPEDEPVHAHEAKWQIWVAALVVLGCLATAGYAIVETFWG